MKKPTGKELLFCFGLILMFLGCVKLAVNNQNKQIFYDLNDLVLPPTHIELSEGDLEISYSYEEALQKYISEFPEDYILPVMVNADKYDIEIEYLYRWMFLESRLGKYNVSLQPDYDGSIGYGPLQLNSKYLEYFANSFYDGNPEDFDPMDPFDNIQVSCAYLRFLSSQTGSLESAFVAYNGGIGKYLSGNSPLTSIEYGKIIVGKTIHSSFRDISDLKIF